ncbi:MAG: sporulation transcriptional regulator SpoIIID [Oscillospiraceae bacterium]
MKGLPEERAVELGKYVIQNFATVREAAKIFNVSKSTVHKDLTERLRYISPTLYLGCRRVLIKNKAERHLRGGMATKKKYEDIKKNGLEK